MFTDLPFRDKSEYGVRESMLGKGGYGQVNKYKCDTDGTCTAIKTFNNSMTDEGVGSDVIREISILVKLQHPNIVKIVDVWNFDKRPSKIFLVLE